MESLAPSQMPKSSLKRDGGRVLESHPQAEPPAQAHTLPGAGTLFLNLDEKARLHLRTDFGWIRRRPSLPKARSSDLRMVELRLSAVGRRFERLALPDEAPQQAGYRHSLEISPTSWMKDAPRFAPLFDPPLCFSWRSVWQPEVGAECPRKVLPQGTVHGKVLSVMSIFQSPLRSGRCQPRTA